MTVEGFSAGAFDDNAQFRVGRWLDTASFPIDGLIVAALAIGGLVALWAWLSGRTLPVPGSSLIPAVGLALVAVGVVEMQYISSEGAEGVSWGFGLYLVVVGGVLAAVSPFIPARPVSKGTTPAH